MTRIRAVCVLGRVPHSALDVLDILQNMGCQLLQSESGDEYIDDKDVAFLICDFESSLYQRWEPLAKIHEKTIFGPAFIRSVYAKVPPMDLVRQPRPIYCGLMTSVTIALADIHDKQKCVSLVHAMGGSARKKFSGSVNVYITSRVWRKASRTAGCLQLYILRPQWVYDCWARRDDSSFNVFGEEFIKKHRIDIFEGLKVYFQGFDAETVDDMKANLERHGGEMIRSISQATHIVYNSQSRTVDPIVPMNGQRVVSDQWLWASINIGYAATEEEYTLPAMKTLRRKNQSLSSPKWPCSPTIEEETPQSLNATPDFDLSNDELEKAVASPRNPDSKKAMVCGEMLQTEMSYINSLKLIVMFRQKLDSEPNMLMSKADSVQVFGKINAILDVHLGIVADLQKRIENKPGALDIAEIWISREHDLMKVYPPFMNSFEMAKKILDEHDSNSPKFHAFLRAQETHPDFNRNNLKDLLIRPVQRLPSVGLLLKEFQKRVSSHSEKKKIDQAMKTIDNVLSRANSVRASNDNSIAVLQMFTEIDGVPPNLVSYRRDLLCQADALSICSTQEFGKLEKKHVRLMLFHDLVIISKIREDNVSTGTFSRLARQASVISLREARKPYKYVKKISNLAFREIAIVLFDDSDESLRDKKFCKDDCNDETLFALTLREERCDEMWIIKPTDCQALLTLIDKISQQIFIDYNRDIEGKAMDVNHCVHPEITDRLLKYRRRLTTTSSTLHDMSTISRNPPSGFRRAISNASMSITSTFGFGRSHNPLHSVSRTNLRNFNGSGVMLSPVPDGETFATPKRGLRSRLTSSTFLNRTLRSDSFRSKESKDDKENRSCGTLTPRILSGSDIRGSKPHVSEL